MGPHVLAWHMTHDVAAVLLLCCKAGERLLLSAQKGSTFQQPIHAYKASVLLLRVVTSLGTKD
eukprot:scaffold54074_cov20-Tisochrysis_lutea.AAC.1